MLNMLFNINWHDSIFHLYRWNRYRKNTRVVSLREKESDNASVMYSKLPANHSHIHETAAVVPQEMIEEAPLMTLQEGDTIITNLSVEISPIAQPEGVSESENDIITDEINSSVVA